MAALASQDDRPEQRDAALRTMEAQDWTIPAPFQAAFPDPLAGECAPRLKTEVLRDDWQFACEWWPPE
jgi:hypothetical protein